MSARQRFGRWVIAPARWLPSRLKEQFGAEIEEVFAARLDEAAERGWPALIAVLLRELIHLPPIHLREVWFRRSELEINMTENTNLTPNTTHEPLVSWKSAALWVLPFLLFGAGLTILELTLPWAPWISLPPQLNTGVVALISALTLTLVILAFTLTNKVPAGWFISLGLALTCAWYLKNYTFGGIPLESWFWWAFLAAAAVAVLRARSIRVLWAPFQAAWQDWTHLSFLLYGVLVFLLLTVQLDSVKGPAAIPVLMGLALIFALGAALALRVVTPLRRVLVLDGTLALILAATVFIDLFTHPDPSFDARRGFGLVILLGIWLGSLFVPGFLGLLRMGLQRKIGTQRP